MRLLNEYRNEINKQTVQNQLKKLYFVSSYTAKYIAGKKNVVIRTNRHSALQLLKRGRIFVDGASYKVSTISRTTQCTVCLEFGHMKSTCSNQDTCAQCGGGHKRSECPFHGEKQVCSNCVKANFDEAYTGHSPNYFLCPVRQRFVNSRRSNANATQTTDQEPNKDNESDETGEIDNEADLLENESIKD